jgi:hypothetical protein
LKPSNLTSVFTLRTSVFLASWYYAEGVDTDVKCGCFQMLDGFVSSHPKIRAQCLLAKSHLAHRHLADARTIRNTCRLKGPNFRGGRKPTYLTSVLTSAKAISVVPSAGNKMDVHWENMNVR